MEHFLFEHVKTRMRTGQKENTLDLVFTRDEDLGKSDHLMMKIFTSFSVKLEDRSSRIKQLVLHNVITME